MTEPSEQAAGPAEATISELARRHNVHRSTVSRALRGGRAALDSAPAAAGRPARPQPVNPGSPWPRYRTAEFDAWWPTRPGVGAPGSGTDTP